MSQQPVVADIAIDVTVECFDAAGNSHHLDTVLGYHRHDPFAVSMTFLTPTEPLTWTFGRDLLMKGLHRPTGDGDVRVSPSISRDEQAIVLVHLSSPDGHLLLQAPSYQVLAFLHRTLELVPSGTESSNLDIDEVLYQLLDS